MTCYIKKIIYISNTIVLSTHPSILRYKQQCQLFSPYTVRHPPSTITIQPYTLQLLMNRIAATIVAHFRAVLLLRAVMVFIARCELIFVSVAESLANMLAAIIDSRRLLCTFSLFIANSEVTDIMCVD